jgi:SAM-dependent methyltransferase
LPSERARREWSRYEGTVQRNLWLQFRRRFLSRALQDLPSRPAVILEVGPGPGRFSDLLVSTGRPVILLDLSLAMIREGRGLHPATRPGGPHWVLGDALRLPVPPRSLAALVALGNVLGFAGSRAGLLLREWDESLAPGGVFAIETSLLAPAKGEALSPRAPAAGREGRRPLTVLRTPKVSYFSRKELDDWFARLGWRLEEATPVAPRAGGSPTDAQQALHRAGGDWRTLLEEEERAGREAADSELPGPWLFRGRAHLEDG